MLFVRWVNHPYTAVFYEEPGCSSNTPYAHQLTTSVSISGSSIHVSWNGMTFQAIRLNSISGQQAANLYDGVPDVPDNAVSGSGSGSSNVGVIVGATLGSIAAIVLIIVIVVGACMLRRKSADRNADSMVYANPSFASARPENSTGTTELQRTPAAFI